MELNIRALFSDETEKYRQPARPDVNGEVTVYFRGLKDNVAAIYFVSPKERKVMEKDSTIGIFDYYKVRLQIENEPLTYYFEVVGEGKTCFYNRIGPSTKQQRKYDFEIIPGFKTPAWAEGAVFYQIFVERFYNGDKSNDPVNLEYVYIDEGITSVSDWSKYPETMGVREFYGGDLQGVLDKLDYLEELGVEVIYFNPIFVSPSNHKYDIQDYDYVDPHFGKIVNDGGEPLANSKSKNKDASKYIKRVTDKANLEASNRLFIELVEEVHKRGMKVILDGVFNHCGSFNKWLDREQIYENEAEYEKGAYISKESPYKNYFNFHDEEKWPYNESYEGWWGHDTLPKLNFEESKELQQEVIRVAKKWVSPPFNVDGWRLDVAADLGYSNEYNHQFWKKFRKAVKESNPDAIILAEHYGDPSSWLKGDEWDTVMNYDAFMEPITWFLTGIEKHSDAYKKNLLGNYEYFFESMRMNMPKLGGQPLRIAMNELSNHDHSRFLTRTNQLVGRVGTLGSEEAEKGIDKGVFRAAVVMQMTWPGAPTIYYGDEAGLCGWTDPDNRRTYPWGNEDFELIEFHKDIIKIHKENKGLIKGSYKDLLGEKDVLSYGRFYEDNKLVVVVNNSNESKKIDIPVWEIGIDDGDVMQRLIMTNKVGYNVGKMDFIVTSYHLKVEIPPISSMVFCKKII